MFVAEEVTVEAGFDDALARLTHLINHGGLDTPSERAYRDGLTALMRVGPFGDAVGVSKLVRVQWLEPVRRGITLTVPMRWEATGRAGQLFPLLDADLTVVKHGEDQVLVGLTGSYRPPLGHAGQTIDRVIMRGVATATVHSLLAGVAEHIKDASAQSSLGELPDQHWRPLTYPQEP